MSIVPSRQPPDVIAGVPVAVRMHPRARRLKLKFDDRRGLLALTVPPRTSRRAALAWAAGHASWVEAQVARQPPRMPLEPGSIIPLRGEEVRLEWVAGASRSVTIDDRVLSCGGLREGFATRVEAWLKRLARDTLSYETAATAARAGVMVRKVSVGDPDSRWGSCSASGAIRYNWRLILAPPAALRFVVAHEVAHRVHMDHSPRFKALEQALFDGDIVAARQLLRRVGPVLRRVGLGP